MRIVGIYLSIVGTALLLIHYMLHGPLVYGALGISCLIIGLTILLLPARERWEAIADFLSTAIFDFYSNLERIAKELDVKARGVYSPIMMSDTKSVRIVVPINTKDVVISKIGIESTPLIAKDARGEALILTPIGHALLSKVSDEIPPVELSSATLEELLRTYLVELLGLCKNLMVNLRGDQIIIVLEGLWRDFSEIFKVYPRATKAIGSPVTSLVVTLLAYSLDRPLRILEETINNTRMTLRVELL